MPMDLDRRHFLKLSSATALAGFCGTSYASGDDAASLYHKVIPARKGLDSAWTASLVSRGSKLDAAIATSKPQELANIGMTVGGIGCGTVYLSGDGQLYVWDIFHRPHEGVVAQRLPVPAGLEVLGGHKKIVRERDGSSYINPPTPAKFPNPFRQEFRLDIDGQAKPRPMCLDGWNQVTFTGRWPIGTVDYADPGCPLNAQLQAWTPFIPLNTSDSSLPVTVMEYTLTNTSKQAVSGKLTGIWENPVLVHSRKKQAHAVASRLESTPKITAITHHPVDDQQLPVGDWGTATIATLGAAAATDTHDGLSQSFKLAPGASTTITFLLSWHFPNIPKLYQLGPQTPQYAKRFSSAPEVANYVGQHIQQLRDATMTWVKTWNDSTLPQWLLDRTILTTNTLQTTTCEVIAGKDYPNGRFWAWEGIGCCPGTCAHVWHYAQGVARLFPDLERNLREISDYQIGLNPDGSIRFRAESSNKVAIDAQTGIILRTWREHLVSADKQFLTRVWSQAKLALQWLISFDGSDKDGLDGLLDGEQHNTLDAEWYGKVHCLCSLYLAALRAGQEMAHTMGDEAFAKECQNTFTKGFAKIATLFNGEFYIQQEDPAHLDKIGVGKGCYIDQVIGQWWAHQVELGRTQDATHTHAALDSLWRYNFVPHIGNFRSSFTMGRFYALHDEAGLVMCTWPNGGLRDDFKKHWQYGYFNECMTGFEWQAAAHMIQEGSAVDDSTIKKPAELIEDAKDLRSFTLRGLAISRAIHDRYAPSRRNPYNEIECSDHYARANASYSVFLAVCGFQYDGPNGIIGFDPKLNPRKFKTAFTAASGWGSFEQKFIDEHKSAKLTLAYGHLTLNEIRLPWINVQAVVEVNKKAIKASIEQGIARFANPVDLSAGDSLVIAL